MTVALSPVYITLLTGTVLPAVTALVTHQLASGRVKAITLAVLSMAAGTANQVLHSHGHLMANPAVLTSIATFATAYVAHGGLLKPVGLTGSAGWVARTFPHGIGLKRTAMGAERSPRHG